MSYDLPKAYDFKSTEQRLYKWWEESGFFQPANDPNKPGFDPSKKPFVITIPPANVTGELHLGHAMFVSMEDLMVRYHRMKGEPTLWLPGTDHAGIATQLQVEKMLAKEGKTRDQLGRKEFERRTWEWKEKYGSIITGQIRRLGASCDWTRERFTLDAGLSRAVREAFVRLYEKGLIYRGTRMINWSPGLRTAVSDLEVEYSQEPGFLYYFKYVLADNPDEYIPVATTRPETILGDTAVAVHPEDERYKRYVGRKVLVPLLNRAVPVIADDYVDREFGTGALKITPAHDPNDYQIGQRYNLEMISILDKEAHINANGGPYAGMDRFECRKKLWADMKAAGLVIKEEPYTLNVPRSQRGGEIVEPMISDQWFVTIKPLAEAALKVVRNGEIKIVPDRFTKVYFNWLENIQDWCISRQLWWGHRIPVWYCDDCGKMTVVREDPTQCAHCGSKHIRQEEDVLDTWFSSGLWPFSTLGWPDETPDYKYFYPTSVLETGYDIIFFWVARMIMDGLEFTGKIPFHTVYLHGLIRDEHGQKMSKTKGNVIDPLGVMDEMGTDALRFTLLVGSTPGNDMNLSLKKVEANRNFANKIWNAGRFIIGSLEAAPATPQGKPDWTLPDSWIWARLQTLIADVERLFDGNQYGEAGRQIYEFFWGEFADWYLEIAKQQLAEGGDRAFYTAQTLVRVLDTCLRLLHPFTPYVTEELWGHLKRAAQERSELFAPKDGWEDALIIARWPEAQAAEGWEAAKVADFTLIQDTVRAIRNLRAEKKVTPGKRIPATIVCGDRLSIFQSQARTLTALAALDPDNLTLVQSLPEKPQGQVSLVISGIEIFLPLAGLVDVENERARLQKELADTQAQIERLETLLSSSFGQRAPAAVVEKERQKLAAFQETAAKLKNQLASL
ncbi:valyl-tRNA synthetase [Longilinea arvoryzae]|uniref:Valine--tRNA ligase n=1 Tax=Longilinea arvoryzae TaxID=360412 RepID=A0A0S7BNS0_9CHLR|nr:valine--tRNA ligase [Longilinea arvoryzae]GAP15493.1 valyl-tRNA synthetase [Longilinea arvoryzae]